MRCLITNTENFQFIVYTRVLLRVWNVIIGDIMKFLQIQ